ncbi:MAG: 50S ribosomal protein L3 [Phycisphaerales bacterium]|nr:MAG: 50S ribosomal protein L3 [Phycisphaerales bacterium]
MLPAILGTKIGMTRIPDERGCVEAVTVIKAGPCVVLQVKDEPRDGYRAIQVGFGDRKPHRSTLPMIGHAAKAGTGPKQWLREFRLEGEADFEPGTVLTVASFQEAEVNWVDVSGVTKGRGFAGAMRRHGFGGQPASHGTERKHRSPGGIGSSAPRGRGRCVKKGKRMAGHMGHDNVTVKSQRLVKVDVENGLLLVRGGVPGPNGGLVVVRKAKTKA